jgi:hypothetical protein
LLRMINTMTSQNTDLSSLDTLYLDTVRQGTKETIKNTFVAWIQSNPRILLL